MSEKTKERPLCLVCNKPISASNCGFPKRQVVVFQSEQEKEGELLKRAVEKGIVWKEFPIVSL